MGMPPSFQDFSACRRAAVIHSFTEWGGIAPGDIARQTRNTFESIRRVLAEAGADIRDIVKLNTYYQIKGEGETLRRSWEEMTRVRMEYLADPGPVGTAVRVTGFAYEDLLIEIEAIASVAGQGDDRPSRG